MKLIICGNGFDKNHGLKTDYNDYKQFVKDEYPREYKDFENFLYSSFPKKNKWNDLEKSLTFDYNKCISDCIQHYFKEGKISADLRLLEMQVEIEEQTRFIYNLTGRYFYEWLSQIDLTKAESNHEFSQDDLFVTFNYTNLLEEIYKIDPGNIFHIHGNFYDIESSNLFNANRITLPSVNTIEDAETNELIHVDEINCDTIKRKIQFGSIYNDSKSARSVIKKEYSELDFYSTIIQPSSKPIMGFIDSASKKIEANYSKLKVFVDNEDVDEVVIMGHSLLGGDIKYYEHILVPLFKGCNWTLYYHEDDTESIMFVDKFSLKKADFINW
jgi:hypothetical protein